MDMLSHRYDRFVRHRGHLGNQAEMMGAGPGPLQSRGNFNVASRFKILHDAAQFRFNVRNGILPQVFLEVAHNYSRMDHLYFAKHAMHTLVMMDRRHLELVGTTFNRLNYKMTAERVGEGESLMAHTDYAAAEREYSRHHPGIAIIDGLLSTKTLDTMLNVLQTSSIWFDVKEGILVAHHSEGLASLLLFQIASEMRERLSGVIGHLHLRRIWACKHLENKRRGQRRPLPGRSTTDPEAIHVHVWITPDASNLDPNTGGLTIYLSQGESDQQSVQVDDEGLLDWVIAQASRSSIAIPYRQNRAVMFPARLFRESADADFRHGFQHMRIGLTFEFGQLERV